MRTRVLAGAAAVAVVTTAVIVGPPMAGSDHDRTGSSYRITYASTEPAVGTRQTVVVEVDRPYRARSRVYDGDALVGGSIWTETGVYVEDADGRVSLVQPVLPGRAGPDVRLDVLLPAAVAVGSVEMRGSSQVGGIPCREYRSRAPLDAELPAPATPDEDTVSCVDASGRILREEWRVDGDVIRLREATGIEAEVALDDEELFGGTAPEVAGLPVLEVRAVSLPGDPVLAVAFPDRLFGLRRDLVVESRDVLPPSATPVPTRVSQRATYTDGARLVTVTQSRALTGPEPALPTGEPFSLPPLDRAVIAPSFDGFTLTGIVGTVRIEIRGPFGPDAFADLVIELAAGR